MAEINIDALLVGGGVVTISLHYYEELIARINRSEKIINDLGISPEYDISNVKCIDHSTVHGRFDPIDPLFDADTIKEDIYIIQFKATRRPV